MKYRLLILAGILLLLLAGGTAFYWWEYESGDRIIVTAVCLVLLIVTAWLGIKALKEGFTLRSIACSQKKRAAQKQLIYRGVTALYMGEPFYEKVTVTLDRPARKLELAFTDRCYVLDLERITVRYDSELCASALASGRRLFGEDWPEMRSELETERQKRDGALGGRIWPKDGVMLFYKTQEEQTLLILLISDVFLEIVQMVEDLRPLLPQTAYSKIEL